MNARINKITAATKLWEGLEMQKQWNQSQPEILDIIEGAITRLRWEIVIATETISPSES